MRVVPRVRFIARIIVGIAPALALSGLCLQAAPAHGRARPTSPGRDHLDAAPTSDDAPPIQRIAVELRGPLAVVTVTRVVSAQRPRDATEEILDLALPERSALLSVEINDRGRWLAVAATPAAGARSEYLRAIDARGVSSQGEPFDDDTTYRLRVARGGGAAGRPSSPVAVRYRFSALVQDSHGRLRLRFPPSPEATPFPAEVTVSGPGIGDLDIAGVHTTWPAHSASTGAPTGASGRVSTRSGWEISYALAPMAIAIASASSKDGPTLEGVAAAAVTSGRESAIAFAIHARRDGAPAPPENVLLLIDRSRSVGLAGLAAEHDVATRLLDLLPPTTRFDALFFDRVVTRLFPMLRPATREAIGALEPEMVPDRLVNGTDLAGAFRAAGELLRREASSFAPRTLLVLITDGAIPDTTTGARLDSALGAVPGIDLGVALLVVRPEDDDGITPATRQALTAVAESRGGVEREVRANEINEAMTSLVDIVAAGGDVFSARVDFNHISARLPGTVPPGAGITGVVRLPGKLRGPAELIGVTHGRSMRAPLRIIPIEASWIRPHAQEIPTPPENRLLSAPALTAWVEPITPRAAPAAPAPVRGTMDRDVIRNTLSLAFMPRARACYQTRSGATAATRDLTGRVRMAIDLVRGEVIDARLESSTLGQAVIETCLRDSAFALEVPRAYHSDEPVTAIVNLVFRPRTPEKRHSAEDSFPISAEIDLILEELKKAEAAGLPR